MGIEVERDVAMLIGGIIASGFLALVGGFIAYFLKKKD